MTPVTDDSSNVEYEYRTVTGDYGPYLPALNIPEEPGWELWEYAPHYWFWRRPK